MKCICCGNDLSINDKYCPNCGQNNDSFVGPKSAEEKEIVLNNTSIITKQDNNFNSYNSSNYNSSLSNTNQPKKRLAREVVAYVLFGLTALALLIQAINGFKSFSNSAYPFAFVLGFFTPAIIGVILIISARNKK